jgi:ubiquinone/menaquinone biosynthesis C-methylase UbiE
MNYARSWLMPDPTPQVDWRSYAQVYDLMAENNPAYQELIGRFKRTIAGWRVESGSTLADLGAGTGNFSIELAQAFPGCQVTHLDGSEGMNSVAKRKAAVRCVSNLEFVTTDVEMAPFRVNSLAAMATVHVLYALPRPRETIARIFDWLQPGGYLFACDAGRMASVLKWTIYLLREFYRRQGFWRTAQFYSRAREVLRQNKRILKTQRNGVYWSHTHAEFRKAIESAGFVVVEASEVYRGNSDLVLGRKPET